MRRLFIGCMVLGMFGSCTTSTVDHSFDGFDSGKPVHVMINQSTDDIDVWKTTFESDAGIDGISVEEFFCNMFDSSEVSVLLLADNLAKAREFCSGLEGVTDTVKGPRVRYLSNVGDVSLNSGSGDYYMDIKHEVASFNEWNGIFTAFAGHRNMDSIYILGVFRGIPDTLRVEVLARATDLGKVSAYGRQLQESSAMKAAGIKGEPETAILRTLGQPGMASK